MWAPPCAGIGRQTAVLHDSDQRHHRAQAGGNGVAGPVVANEAVLAAVPDIIMEVDTHKVYTWANRAGLEFFGDEVLGMEAATYFEGEQDTYAQVQPLFDGKDETYYVESWQRRQDGEKRLLGWWCHVLKGAAGNVTGALSSAVMSPSVGGGKTRPSGSMPNWSRAWRPARPSSSQSTRNWRPSPTPSRTTCAPPCGPWTASARPC